MAPLTWREVSAPTFSGVTESQRLSGQLLSTGFDSAIKTLDGLGESQKASANGELLSRIASFGKPEDLRTALADGTIFQGLDRAAITPETFDRANAQSRALLGDVQTNVQTDGMRLNNTNQGMVNDQLAWSNGKAQAFEAARPAAVDLVNQIRSLSASGTPEGRAKADELMRSGSAVFSAAGWKPEDINNQVNGNLVTTEAGVGTNTTLRDQGDVVKAHGDTVAAKELFGSVMQASGNDVALAERTIRENPKIAPAVAQQTLAMLGSPEATLLQGPDTNAASYLLEQQVKVQQGGPVAQANDSGSPIVYANKDATRNDPLMPQLEGVMAPILSDLGVTMHVVSGGQEAKGEGGARTGSTRHDHGGAGDVDFYAADGRKLSPKNPQDLPILQEIVRRGWAKGVTGWGEGDNYMGAGRVHLGFGTPSIWGANGKSENAPQWMTDAVKGLTPGMPPSIDAVAAGVRNGPVASSTPVKDLFESALQAKTDLSASQSESLFQGTLELNNQAATVMDAMTVDGAFGTAALATSLLDTSLSRESQSASIARVKAGLGEGIDIADPELADNINAIKDKYGMSFGQAATIVENSIHQEPWVLQWLQGKANVDFGRFDALVSQVYNKDGKTREQKLRPGMELLQTARSKENAATNLTNIQSQVTAAQQRYVNLKARAETSSTPALQKELQRAQLTYQTLLGQMQETVKQVAGDPRIGLGGQ